ncbi:MAG: hypothetical protein DWQ31_19845 [Planctomycetota bacterium]|nr:MAG: hypothetical protein DWQ31_19845 [Planctomycetota bacterium]REK18062.1 MAG: hypothetical protein DWQ42_20970 [Planctomycetota bacterium]REK40214.1 MAG: hypothetical protein DWQ46_16860 [Planctomycetota bacterium]
MIVLAEFGKALELKAPQLTISPSNIETLSAEIRRLRSETQVTDGDIQEICQRAPQLESADLAACNNISAVGLEALATLPHFEELSVSFCEQFGSRELDAISRIETLTKLDVSGCTSLIEYPGANVEPFGRLKNLQYLNLNYVYATTDAVLEELRACRELIGLSLLCCSKITDAGINAITESTQLEVLLLSDFPEITDVTCKRLKTHAPKLRELAMACLDDITDDGVAAIRELPNLEKLSLDSCKAISEDAILQLTKMVSLKYMQLVNMKLSESTVDRLQRVKNVRIEIERK